MEWPERVPNLVSALPALDGPPEIVGWYDISKAGRPFLYCAHCRGHHHWKGYVLALPDAMHALLAQRTCGKDQYGLDWVVHERGFNAEVDRQDMLRRVLRICPALPVLEAYLARLEGSGAATAVEHYLLTLRKEFGPLSQAIARAVRAGGALEIPEDFRDREAEERQARRFWPDLVAEVEGETPSFNAGLAKQELQRLIDTQGQVIKQRPRLIGRLAGSGLFEIRASPSPSRTAIAEVRNAAAILAGDLSGASFAGKKLAEAHKRLTDAVRDLENAIGLLAALDDFTSAESLALIVTWGNQMPGVAGRLKREGRTLLDKRTSARLSPPTLTAAPPISELEPFWSAVRLDR